MFEKKFTGALLAMVLTFGLLLSACGTTAPKKEDATMEKAPATMEKAPATEGTTTTPATAETK